MMMGMAFGKCMSIRRKAGGPSRSSWIYPHHPPQWRRPNQFVVRQC
jgi:hypothetical protein